MPAERRALHQVRPGAGQHEPRPAQGVPGHPQDSPEPGNQLHPIVILLRRQNSHKDSHNQRESNRCTTQVVFVLTIEGVLFRKKCGNRRLAVSVSVVDPE